MLSRYPLNKHLKNMQFFVYVHLSLIAINLGVIYYGIEGTLYVAFFSLANAMILANYIKRKAQEELIQKLSYNYHDIWETPA